MEKEKSKSSRKELNVSRLLNAPVELVWEVWTNPEHIKNWWGPDGFTNTILAMNVKPKGEWNLIMHGPDGTDYKNKSVFTEVIKHKKIVYRHVSAPKFTATAEFESIGNKTQLHWKMEFESAEQLKQVVKTFKADEGLKQNVDKLSAYLKLRLKLWNENKTTQRVRVCTYLNFPGNTEEAFNFYRSVFGGEFGGKGIQRFGDIPAGPDAPKVPAEIKNLILHVELEILGGHILMATDAPESMGFKMQSGNNMHISVEPKSRNETTRIFNALSKGGVVTMPLKDMFFGAYYGSLTDKYGINWMLNFPIKK